LLVRFNSVFNFDNLSIIRREELAEIALKHFYSSPLFGVGLNNFLIATATSELITGPSRFLQPVHNIFLLTLSETGLVGFLGFLLLVIAALRNLLKKRKLLAPRYLLF